METCKSGSEGGCRKPVAYAIRRLCPTLRVSIVRHGAADVRQQRVFGAAEPGAHGPGGVGQAAGGQ